MPNVTTAPSFARATIFSRIDTVPNLAALWTLMVRHCDELGFGAATYMLLDRGQPGRALAIFEHGVRPRLVEAYSALDDSRQDAMVRLAMATGRPQLRSRVKALGSLTAQEREHVQAMDDLGLAEVLAFPLFGPHGHDGIGALFDPADPGAFEECHWLELHMIAQAAHLKSLELQRLVAHPVHELSQREIEILRWVAQGKSNGVIAEIVGLAPGTVDTYLRRVFEKLDVADRTSAAVKGVAMGLIRA